MGQTLQLGAEEVVSIGSEESKNAIEAKVSSLKSVNKLGSD